MNAKSIEIDYEIIMSLLLTNQNEHNKCMYSIIMLGNKSSILYQKLEIFIVVECFLFISIRLPTSFSSSLEYFLRFFMNWLYYIQLRAVSK